jgi:hypothetical protein
MSTRPEATSDRLVNLLSQWLARHVSSEEVEHFLVEQPLDDIPPEERELVQELRAELEGGASRGDVEMLVRETMEALALGA